MYIYIYSSIYTSIYIYRYIRDAKIRVIRHLLLPVRKSPRFWHRLKTLGGYCAIEANP